MTDTITPNTNCILINDEKTRKIETIDGIKLPLLKHQKVIIQQLIDAFHHGQFKLISGQTLQTHNFWLKGSIGTGKSLCLLSLIQYFKNTNFKDIQMKVPLSQTIMSIEKNYDKWFNTSQFTWYIQNNHMNYFNFDIVKQQQYTIDNYGKFITYNSHNKQALIFVQQQVYGQFEEYIKDQTSLSYFGVNNPTSFIDFILNPPEEDIILWNTDTVDVTQIFNNIVQYIRLYTQMKKLSDVDYIKNLDYLQTTYKNCKNFNDFWVINESVWFLIAYDDFDLMNLTSFYPIKSLYTIFVGSTMVLQQQNFTNPVQNFINNKMHNQISSFRIDETQLQQILQLPENHINNIMCQTPNRLFITYKVMQYLYEIFSVIKPTKTTLQLNNQLFQELLNEKITFQKIFEQTLKEFDLLFNEAIFSEGLIMDLMNNIKMICLGSEIEKQAKARHLNDKQIQMLLQKNIIIHRTEDQMLVQNFYKQKPQKQQEDIIKISKMPFALNFQEIKQNMIVCPFGGSMIAYLNENCYITRCCCQGFDKEHIDKAVQLGGDGRIYCAFCQKQIHDIKRHIFDVKKQSYFTDKIECTNKSDQKYVQKIGSSKFNELKKIIMQNKEKKIMIIAKNLNVQALEKALDYTTDQSTALGKTRQPNIYQIGQMDINYNQDHKNRAMRFAQTLEERQLIQQTQLNEDKPDITIIKSLKQIIGANMTYIDLFIFCDVPEQLEEIQQIIGRSRRIGRREDIHSYFLYYPIQKIMIV